MTELAARGVVEKQGDGPLVSVIIPARNEERFLDACLDSVLSQTLSDLEVIVIDGDSTDRTAALVRERMREEPRLALVHNPDRLTPVSLNLGVLHARGTWVVRVDGHATVCDSYVERAVQHLSSGEWAGVGGRVDPVGSRPAGRAIGLAMSSRFGIGNAVHHYGTEPVAADHVPFPAYSRELLTRHGGWDETLPVNQDFELDWRIGRAGGRLLYDPAMTISYHGCQSVPAVFRQFRRYGRGKAKVVRLHPESLRARHLVAPAMVAGTMVAWLLAAVLIFVVPTLAVLCLAVVVPYLLAVALASFLLARRLTGWRERVWLPVALVAMHWGWGLGFWQGLLTRAPR
jgi:glycosyltransferase involved in cell wall biosynthesis